MSATSYSPSTTRGEEFKVSLLFGALFPVFIFSAVILRAIASPPNSASPRRSVLGEAWENLSIAISYGLMARAMLQSFARD